MHRKTFDGAGLLGAFGYAASTRALLSAVPIPIPWQTSRTRKRVGGRGLGPLRGHQAEILHSLKGARLDSGEIANQGTTASLKRRGNS